MPTSYSVISNPSASLQSHASTNKAAVRVGSVQWTLVFSLMVLAGSAWMVFNYSNPYSIIQSFQFSAGSQAAWQGFLFSLPADVPFLLFFLSVIIVDTKREFVWATFRTFAVTTLVSLLVQVLSGMFLHPFLVSYTLLVPIGIVVLDNLVNTRFKKPRLLFAVLFGLGYSAWLGSKSGGTELMPVPDVSGPLFFWVGLVIGQACMAALLIQTSGKLAELVKRHRQQVIVPLSSAIGLATLLLAIRLITA